ncbi:MAG: hypothetical protein V2A58_01160 [Planctomycetota bacterium]
MKARDEVGNPEGRERGGGDALGGEEWGSWRHIGRVAWRLSVLGMNVSAVFIGVIGVVWFLDLRGNNGAARLFLALAIWVGFLLLLRAILRQVYPEARLANMLGIRPLRTEEHLDADGIPIRLTFYMGAERCLRCLERTVGRVIVKPRVWLALHVAGMALLAVALAAVFIMFGFRRMVSDGVVMIGFFGGFFGGLAVFGAKALPGKGFCTRCGDYTWALWKKTRAGERKKHLSWKEPKGIRRIREAMERKPLAAHMRWGLAIWIPMFVVGLALLCPEVLWARDRGEARSYGWLVLGAAMMASLFLGLVGAPLVMHLLCRSKVTLTGNGVKHTIGDWTRTHLYERIRNCRIAQQKMGEGTASVLVLTVEGAAKPVLLGIAPGIRLDELERVLREHGVTVERQNRVSQGG